MANEAVVLKHVMLEASRLGCVIFRNNVGAFKTVDGRFIRTGLCVGSSDLIGWYKGRFLAIEVKGDNGRISRDQQNFINQVNNSGGIGLFCDDAKKLEKLLAEKIIGV